MEEKEEKKGLVLIKRLFNVIEGGLFNGISKSFGDRADISSGGQ